VTTLCKCGCGKLLERHSYETEKAFAKRLASGLFRARCKKSLSVAPKTERVKPTLELLSANYERGDMTAQVKETTPRDAAYLDWIRTFDCIECQWPAHLKGIEAHHIETGGTSIKCSDYLTVPLCTHEPVARGCHAKADKTPEFVERYKLWALRFNALWIKSGNKIKKGGE
jgi:hypothetical protein